MVCPPHTDYHEAVGETPAKCTPNSVIEGVVETEQVKAPVWDGGPVIEVDGVKVALPRSCGRSYLGAVIDELYIANRALFDTPQPREPAPSNHRRRHPHHPTTPPTPPRPATPLPPSPPPRQEGEDDLTGIKLKKRGRNLVPTGTKWRAVGVGTKGTPVGRILRNEQLSQAIKVLVCSAHVEVVSGEW